MMPVLLVPLQRVQIKLMSTLVLKPICNVTGNHKQCVSGHKNYASAENKNYVHTELIYNGHSLLCLIQFLMSFFPLFLLLVKNTSNFMVRTDY